MGSVSARLVSRYLGDAIEVAQENAELRRLVWDVLTWIAGRDDLSTFANDLIRARFESGGSVVDLDRARKVKEAGQ